MAHAGSSHGGGHSHSHSHSSSSSYYYYGESSVFELILSVLFLVIVLCCFCMKSDVQKLQIRGKEKINATYEITDYVIPESSNMNVDAYFINKDQLETSLEEFYDKTGVQLVVYIARSSYSPKEALDVYYDIFDDEYHALIIVSPTWSNNEEGFADYVVGDNADDILNGLAMNYLISDEIKYSHDGAKWEVALADFTEILLSKQ